MISTVPDNFQGPELYIILLRQNMWAIEMQIMNFQYDIFWKLSRYS
jgi:hypothetical protein